MWSRDTGNYLNAPGFLEVGLERMKDWKRIYFTDIALGQANLAKVMEKWNKIYTADCTCIKKALDKSRGIADN